MATKIPYHTLKEFPGLRNELIHRFGSQLADLDMDVRLKARDSALEFMREKGFYVDSQFKYVTLPDSPEEHFMLALGGHE
jgi:hypothetical protein